LTGSGAWISLHISYAPDWCRAGLTKIVHLFKHLQQNEGGLDSSIEVTFELHKFVHELFDSTIRIYLLQRFLCDNKKSANALLHTCKITATVFLDENCTLKGLLEYHFDNVVKHLDLVRNRLYIINKRIDTSAPSIDIISSTTFLSLSSWFFTIYTYR
jgi:hypothetical protein